jgi:hypothetical protein
MDYCGPNGIPLSTFLSWPIDDQEAALWWQAEKQVPCSNCGTAEWEWEEDPNAYEIAKSVCKGCAMIQAAQKEAEAKPGGMKFTIAEMFPGMKIRLVRSTD